MRTYLSAGPIAATLAAAATVASAQGYNDGTGREWRQVTTTTGISWSQVASVCPTDGSGPCAGTASGRDLTGWYWASQAEVQEFFALFAPEIADLGCVGGPAYVLSGLSMLDGGVITPTWSYYTTFGGYLYVSGWTSTRGTEGNAILGAASAQYPVFDGALCVTGQAPINTIPELAADPQTAALGMLAPVPGTDYQLVALPLSFQGQRPAITAPAPALGEYRRP